MGGLGRSAERETGAIVSVMGRAISCKDTVGVGYVSSAAMYVDSIGCASLAVEVGCVSSGVTLAASIGCAHLSFDNVPFVSVRRVLIVTAYVADVVV